MFGSGGDFSVEDRSRLLRIEQKLDLLLSLLQAPSTLSPLEAEGFLRSSTPALEEVWELADSGRKLEAIKRYREIVDVGLKEAKDAVDAYLAARGRTL